MKIKHISVITLSMLFILLTLSNTSLVLAAGPGSSNSTGPTLVLPNPFPPPPSGFNPLTATAESLKMYGFPPKPDDPTALKSWEQAMINAKHWINPEPCYTIKLTHGGYKTNWDNQSWAGISAETQYNGGQPNSTCATWVIPTYQRGYHTGEVASYWTGIGGQKIINQLNYSQDYIVQAGADANLSWLGDPQQPNYQFWYEDHDYNQSNPVYFPSVSISGGNTLYTYIQYYGSTSQAWFENETTGYFFIKTFNSPYYNGDSAEFIFEKVAGNYDNTIPDVPFSFCQFWYPAGNGGYFNNYWYTVDRQYSGGVRAQPQNIGSYGSFTIHCS